MRTSINLLPLGYRRGLLMRRRLLQWFLVWVVCALAASGGWWLKRHSLAALTRDAETAEEACLPLQEIADQRDRMKNELTQLHAQGTVLGQLRAERPPVTLLGLASAAAQRCGGRLYIHGLSFQRNEVSDTPAAKPKNPRNKAKPQPAPKIAAGPWALVTYDGAALDNLAVATFVAGLRDTGLFRRVELKSSIGKKTADTPIRSFVVECDI